MSGSHQREDEDMEAFFLCTHLAAAGKVLRLSRTYNEIVGMATKEDFGYGCFLEGRVR